MEFIIFYLATKKTSCLYKQATRRPTPLSSDAGTLWGQSFILFWRGGGGQALACPPPPSEALFAQSVPAPLALSPFRRTRQWENSAFPKGTTAAASRFEQRTSRSRVRGLIHWTTAAPLNTDRNDINDGNNSYDSNDSIDDITPEPWPFDVKYHDWKKSYAANFTFFTQSIVPHRNRRHQVGHRHRWSRSAARSWSSMSASSSPDPTPWYLVDDGSAVCSTGKYIYSIKYILQNTLGAKGNLSLLQSDTYY